MKRQTPTKDPRFTHRPRNGCGACRADLTSLRLFEAHRIGDHALDFSEHENGRRCLDAEEMLARGWERDAKGRWHDPARVDDARRRLRHVAEAQTAAPTPKDDSEAA